MLLLRYPVVNHGSTDQRATARANMWDRWKTGHLARKNVRQVRPRNAKVIGCSLNVHDFAMDESLI
jgi:hypothetical protein